MEMSVISGAAWAVRKVTNFTSENFVLPFSTFDTTKLYVYSVFGDKPLRLVIITPSLPNRQLRLLAQISETLLASPCL